MKTSRLLTASWIDYRLPLCNSMGTRCRSRASLRVTNASKREAKNPKMFSSMDILRESLQDNQGIQAGLSGLLKWLSTNSFGYNSKTQRPSRNFSQLHVVHSEDTMARARQVALLMQSTESYVLKLSSRFPGLLVMDPAELVQRMVLLKRLLPACDVVRMVELQPRLLLTGNLVHQEAAITHNMTLLRKMLEGADVDLMVQEDPALLFEDLEEGLVQLHDLWSVDSLTLQNSSPQHLALAIRALSVNGPPAKY